MTGSTLNGRVPTVRSVILEDFQLAPDATDDDLRSAVFQRLDDTSLSVSIELTAATSLIAGRALTTAQTQQLQFQRAERQLEVFCQKYFELRPSQRRARYEELLTECELSTTAIRRLKALEAGLDVESVPLARLTPAQQSLANILLMTFTATPHEQIELRHRYIKDLSVAGWLSISEVDRFKQQYPQLVRLEPTLVEEVGLLAPDNQSIKVASLNRRNQVQSWARQQRSREANAGGGSSRWQLLILIVPLLSMLSGLFNGNRSDSPPHNDTRPSFTFPPAPEPDSTQVRNNSPPVPFRMRMPNRVIVLNAPLDSHTARQLEAQLRAQYGDVEVRWEGTSPQVEDDPTAARDNEATGAAAEAVEELAEAAGAAQRAGKSEAMATLSDLVRWPTASPDSLNENLPQISREYIKHFAASHQSTAYEARRLAGEIVKTCRAYQSFDYQFSEEALQAIENLQAALDGKATPGSADGQADAGETEAEPTGSGIDSAADQKPGETP